MQGKTRRGTSTESPIYKIQVGSLNYNREAQVSPSLSSSPFCTPPIQTPSYGIKR